MIEEIKKRLEAGEVVELECINVYSFMNNNKGRVEEKGEILSSALVIDNVGDGRAVICNSNYFLRESDLEYFRIKCPAPTFDDLIDVAVKAYKDGTADKLAIGYDGGIERVMLHVNGYAYSYYQSSDMSGHIEHINSLYTETFVIESQSDLSMIKLNDKKTKVKLTNGELVNDEFWDNLKNMTGKTQFLLLKGATVTQKRDK